MRLISTLLIFTVCLGFWSSLIPRSLGVPVLDVLLATPFVGWFMTIIFCNGFVHAINMADGANGLMSGIFAIVFTIFYLETDMLVFAVLMTSCGLFAIFNIISGRLFPVMQEPRTGSVLVISDSIFLVKTFFSTFLAVLFAYPRIDILITVIRRRLKGRSILLPDNDHLHNRIHYHFQRWVSSKTLANSMTGILIAFFSSGLALVGFFRSVATNKQSVGLDFLAQCAVSLAFWCGLIVRRVSMLLINRI